MRRRTLVLLLVPAALLALLLIARAATAPLLHPALGFAAKVSCSGVLAGGATLDQVRQGFPDERLRRFIRVRIDGAAGAAHASVPLLARRTAIHRPGLGCTLQPVGTRMAPVPPPPALTPLDPARAELPWPEGDAAAAKPSARLAAVVDSAFLERDGEPQRRTLAVVIVHRGRISAERYAEGWSAHHRLAGWSMTKSVTSALAGILAGDGVLDVDAPPLRPEWQDDARSRITLRQLLHMSSGLEFEESYAPTGEATRMLFASPDAAAMAARSPLTHEPGTHWYYSSGTTNIIAAYMRALIGDDAYYALPSSRLFEPIGMRSAVIEPDPAGTFVGSSFMYATARDWARFGLLYLQDGVWNGQRILPEGWVQWSVTPAPAAPLGQYGAHWWLNAGEAADTARRLWPDLPRDIYWASGFQGQYVAIVPSHDLVIVRLGMTDREGRWRLGNFLRSVLASFDAP